MFRCRRLRRPLVVLTFLAGTLPALSFAQQQQLPSQDPGASPWGLGVGIGVASMKRPYAGADYKTLPIPALSYENDTIRLAGIGVDLKLGAAGPVSFALRTKFALGDGYKSSDAPILEGMQARKGSLWIGPAVAWNAGFARFSAEVLGDALRKSDGVQAKLGVERGFRAGPFLFAPHVAADFVDRKYVQYYYGVTAAQATANRPAYDGRSTVNIEAGFRTVYLFDAANSLFSDINTTALGKGITDSPLVDRKVTPGVALGYLHRF